MVRNDLSVLQPHLPSSDVVGRSLLHLQCHIGTDTASWARVGAVNVTGLDLSPNSLHHARRIAERDGQAVTWVQGDAQVASSLIDEQFDTVVTGAGTIVWLPELSAWAHSIHDLLTPGGVFMIRDDHPILAAMEFEPWTVSDDYLSGGGTRTYDAAGTYTENTEVAIRQTTNYEWRHDLSEVLTALLEADLRIEAVHELPYMDWPAFPGLIHRCVFLVRRAAFQGPRSAQHATRKTRTISQYRSQNDLPNPATAMQLTRTAAAIADATRALRHSDH